MRGPFPSERLERYPVTLDFHQSQTELQPVLNFGMENLSDQQQDKVRRVVRTMWAGGRIGGVIMSRHPSWFMCVGWRRREARQQRGKAVGTVRAGSVGVRWGTTSTKIVQRERERFLFTFAHVCSVPLESHRRTPQIDRRSARPNFSGDDPPEDRPRNHRELLPGVGPRRRQRL